MNDTDKVLEALKSAFKDMIKSGGGNVGDGKEDVKMPNDSVWQKYAEAVISALK